METRDILTQLIHWQGKESTLNEKLDWAEGELGRAGEVNKELLEGCKNLDNIITKIVYDKKPLTFGDKEILSKTHKAIAESELEANKEKGWSCPNCGVIDGANVTFREHCEMCGAKVK